jgi:predicted lipoprotein with Yx(FWY)xxD motif
MSELHRRRGLDLPPPTPFSVSVMIENGRYVFRTEDGRPIYTYGDAPSYQSACGDTCANEWAPVLADAERTVGDWSTFPREDGTLQWGYKGRAAYYPRGHITDLKLKKQDGSWRELRP